MQKRSFILLLVGLALLLSAAPVLAQDGTSDDQVVVGQSFLNGNLAVVGGSADIEEEATLAGDMAVFGGAVRIAGRVTGDVVAFGGSVELASTANVRGDLVVLGGTLRCGLPAGSPVMWWPLAAASNWPARPTYEVTWWFSEER